VIIASILAAFALDAWWENAQERVEERETLQALAVEFSAARETIRFYRSSQERILAGVTLVSDSLHRALERGSNSVTVPDTALALAHIPPTTSVSLGTLSGLISSGRLGIIQDRELRAALGSWGNELAELTEEETDSRALAFGDLDRVLRARISTYGLWALGSRLVGDSVRSQDHATVRSIPVDTEVIGVFQLRESILAHAIDEFDPLLQAVDSILGLIDDAL